MPSRQADGFGLGDWLGVEVDPPVGVVVGAVCDPLDPPLGVVDVPPLVEPAGELVPGRADGLVDRLLLPGVADGVVARMVAALVGPTTPLTGDDVLDGPDEAWVGDWPVDEPPVVAVPAGDWFAVGASWNAPDMSSATMPALATRAPPTANAVTRLRWFHCGWPDSLWLGGPGGAGGPVGSDMRDGTFHSSEP